MTSDDAPSRFTLGRWSERKRAAARGDVPPEASPDLSPQAESARATAPESAPVAAPETAPRGPAAAPLPPVDSLTIDSDFAPFMQPEVEGSIKRAALRKLFRDPHFNVMDGLDVYIDDYSKPDPIEPEFLQRLAHARYIFDPPPTRVNAQGVVEDVPASAAAGEVAERGAAPGEAVADAPPEKAPGPLAVPSQGELSLVFPDDRVATPRE